MRSRLGLCLWVLSVSLASSVASADELLRKQPLRSEPPAVLPEALSTPPDIKALCDGANPQIEAFQKAFPNANPDCFTDMYGREQSCLSQAKSFCGAPSMAGYISLYWETAKHPSFAPLRPPRELLCGSAQQPNIEAIKRFFPRVDNPGCFEMDVEYNQPGLCTSAAEKFCQTEDSEDYRRLAALVMYYYGYNSTPDYLKSNYFGTGAKPAGSKDKSDAEGPVSKVLGSSSWQTALINGLSSFVVKRAKAEVISWALDTLQSSLCRAGYLDSAQKYYFDGVYYFPETCADLSSQQERALSAQRLAQVLRQDAEALPMRVAAAIISAKHQLEGELLPLLSELSLSVLRREEPAELVRGWAKSPSLAAQCKELSPEDALPVGCMMATFGALYTSLEELGGLPNNPSEEQILTLTHKVIEKTRPKLLALYGLTEEELTKRSSATQSARRKAHPRLKALLLRFGENADVEAVRGFVKESLALRAHLSDWADRINDPNPEEYALQSVERTLSLYQSGLSLFGIEPSPKVLRAAHLTHDLINGLHLFSDLIQQSREGVNPLELLAGLSKVSLLRAQCEAYEPTQKLPVGCALATLGLMVEHFGAAAKLTDEEVSRPSRLYQLTLSVLHEASTNQSSFQEKLLALYGRSSEEMKALPPYLVELFEGRHLGQASNFLLSLHALRSELSLQDKAPSDDPLVLLARAGRLLSALSDVLQDGAALFGAGSSEELALTLQAVEVFGLMASGQYPEGAKKTLELSSQAGLDVLPAALKEQLPLVVALLNAKTAEEAEAALEAAAAPVGSWKLKRSSHVLSVTALAGVLGGAECPVGAASCPLRLSGLVGGEAPIEGGAAAGPLGMIGVEYSRTLSTRDVGKFFRGSNVALFLSLLDVGQLAWVRVSNTRQEDDPNTPEDESSEASITSEVNVAQVFSPGLYLRVGVGRSPFVLGVGGSFAPALRQYGFSDNGAFQEELFSTLRLGVFAAVDITVLSLYEHKPKRR